MLSSHDHKATVKFPLTAQPTRLSFLTHFKDDFASKPALIDMKSLLTNTDHNASFNFPEIKTRSTKRTTPKVVFNYYNPNTENNVERKSGIRYFSVPKQRPNRTMNMDLSTATDEASFEDTERTTRDYSLLPIKIRTEPSEMGSFSKNTPKLEVNPIEIISKKEMYIEKFTLEDIKRPSKADPYEPVVKTIFYPMRRSSVNRYNRYEEEKETKTLSVEKVQKNEKSSGVKAIKPRSYNPSRAMLNVEKQDCTDSKKEIIIPRQTPSNLRQGEKSKDSKLKSLKKSLLNRNRLNVDSLQPPAKTEPESTDPVTSTNKLQKAIEENKEINLKVLLKTKLKTAEEKRKTPKITLLASIYEGRPCTIFLPYLPECHKMNDFSRCQQYKLSEGDTIPGYICMTSCTAATKILENAGIEELATEYFSIYWGRIPSPDLLEMMRPWQKINHFPGSKNLGRKDNLWRNYNRMRARFPEEYNYMPQTYVLNTDAHIFFGRQQSAKNDTLWIMKPAASSCGQGISLLHKNSRIPSKKNYIVSEYIANPHLINNLKYDLRIYVLVSSMDPLRVYIYDEGLVRFATKDYSSDFQTLTEKYAHLTNYALNKDSPDYLPNTNITEDNFASKWSLRNLRKTYQKHGIDYDKLLGQIKDIAVKTLISVEPYMLPGSNRGYSSQKKCFELYGFDILVDADLKPWLLEVNAFPSLNTDSPLDNMIKSSLLCDTFNLIGLKVGNLEKERTRNEDGLPRTKRRLRDIDIDELTWDNCSEMLNTDDWEILFEAEEELYRKGNFELIFPLKENIDVYKKMFEIERYNNVLLWKYKSLEADLLTKITRLVYAKGPGRKLKHFIKKLD